VSAFYQQGPTLANQYTDDPLLEQLLRHRLPASVFEEIRHGLTTLGGRAVTEIAAAGEAAEADPPRHVPYDAWGRRVDRIETPAAWRTLERIAVEEGLVATAYERRHGPWSRVHQFARFYLYAPSSATFSCPLAMTDGAARCLELHGGPLRATIYPRLVTRDPEAFWTSGQWMTERTGGSDVAETATVARPSGGRFSLHGIKWFTSATTSQMALTLARIEGSPPAGTKSLSLFCVELRDPSGALHDIRILRLKDKLGTRALPTAELALEGTPAALVGDAGHGVAKIASMFSITRIANACAAAAGMRRALALACDYARKRRAFGQRLIDLPLHAATLADLELECQAACHLVFFLAELLGRDECAVAMPADAALLRMLTPVVKLYTAKQAIAVASEVVEAFGGAGYIEDTGVPRLLRDAQVLSIWEGTTNVLSLDVLRAIDGGALADAITALRQRIQGVSVRGPLTASVASVAQALERIAQYAGRQGRGAAREAGARGLAVSVARTTAGLLMLEHAAWGADGPSADATAIAARRWCARNLTPLTEVDEVDLDDTQTLLRSQTGR